MCLTKTICVYMSVKVYLKFMKINFTENNKL